MRCSRCGDGRLALVALPDRGETGLRVCLACGNLWSVEPDPAPADGRR